MAYNLYQAQMARAWTQRVEKEQQIAERFWSNFATQDNNACSPFLHAASGMHMYSSSNLKDIDTCSSIAPTYVSDLSDASTELLRDQLAALEKELMLERELRLRIEEDLNQLKQRKI